MNIRDSPLKPHILKIYPKSIRKQQLEKVFDNKMIETKVQYEVNDQVNFKIASIKRCGIIKKFTDPEKTRAVIQLAGGHMLLFEIDVLKLSKNRINRSKNQK